MAEQVTQQAQDWMNQQENLKIIDINFTIGTLSAMVVVWYEDSPS